MLPAGSVIPRRAWHRALWMLLPQALFLGGDLGSWQEVAYMLLKLEEETETPSGMRHKRRQGGRGALRLGWGPSAGAVPLPQGRGEPAGQTGGVCGCGRKPQAFHLGFNPAGLSTSWGRSHFSNRKYTCVWAQQMQNHYM